MKWSKKICIEYLTQLKDPLEEASQVNQTPVDRLRRAIQDYRQQPTEAK